MKIAILQLARFGDIVMTWPLVRALKRQYPGSQITMIVRETYRQALTGLEEIDQCLLLPSKEILEPVFESFMDIEASSERLDNWLQCLETQEYDWVINLSFSPLSAEICSLFEGKAQLSGYSRFQDGSLKIHGRMAQYFYDQVGTERPNRLHLVEVFSRLLHLQLQPDDFRMPVVESRAKGNDYFTIHLGGSEQHKIIDVHLLTEFLLIMLPQHDRDVYLLGSAQEKNRAQELLSKIPPDLKHRVRDFCGQTSFLDLFSILHSADFHLGGDSLPLQICMMSQTPIVLLSFTGTNFWETGPLVRGSLVIRHPISSEVKATQLVNSLNDWFNGVQIQDPHVFVATGIGENNHSGCFIHQWPEWSWHDFYQDLMNEIYFDQSEKGFIHLNQFPLIRDGIEQLSQANMIILDLLRKGANTPDEQKALAELAGRVDQIFKEIGRYHPVLDGVVRWATGLKSQIKPGTFAQIIHQSLKVYSTVQRKVDMMKMDGTIIESRLQANFEKEHV